MTILLTSFIIQHFTLAGYLIPPDGDLCNATSAYCTSPNKPRHWSDTAVITAATYDITPSRGDKLTYIRPGVLRSATQNTSPQLVAPYVHDKQAAVTSARSKTFALGDQSQTVGDWVN